MEDRFKGKQIGIFAFFHIVQGFHANGKQAAVLQTDDGDEQADTDGNGVLQAVGNGDNQHLPDLGHGQNDEDDAGDKYGSQTHLPGKWLIRCGGGQYNRGKIGIQPHARSQRHRKINEDAHSDGKDTCGDGSCQENSVPIHTGPSEGIKSIRVDRQNIGHGHKRGQTGHNFRSNRGAALLQLEKTIHTACFLLFFMNGRNNKKKPGVLDSGSSGKTTPGHTCPCSQEQLLPGGPLTQPR
ncbi:hypothetical protein D3C76_1151660 [compost metagenome]